MKIRDQLWKGKRRAFVIADTHFGDALAFAKFQRPFKDVDSADEGMIAAINEVVSERDTLLHVGDVFGEREWTKDERRKAKQLRERIACRTILLVRGNLDPIGERWFDGMFESVDDVLTWKGWPSDDGAHADRRVIACHYPMRQWQGWPNGALHLYGHVHGTLAEQDRSTDVGVDCWSYRPLELAPLLTWLAHRPWTTPSEWPRLQVMRDRVPMALH